MIKTLSFVVVSIILTTTGLQAAGFPPNANIGDGIDITNVMLRPTDNPSLWRISFVLENFGSQPARLTGLTVGGNVSDIIVGGAPLDRMGPGLLVRHDEKLDFSTSHLVATVQYAKIVPHDLDHIVVDLEIDGAVTQIEIHKND